MGFLKEATVATSKNNETMCECYMLFENNKLLFIRTNFFRKKKFANIKEKSKYFEVPEVILFERRVLIGLALLVELLTFAALVTVLCKDCFVGIESASA